MLPSGLSWRQSTPKSPKNRWLSSQNPLRWFPVDGDQNPAFNPHQLGCIPNPGREVTQEIGHLISLIALIDTLDTLFWLNYRTSPIWSLSQFLQGVALQNHHFGPTSELQNIQLQYLNLVKPTILQISQFSMSHPNPTKKNYVLLGTPFKKKKRETAPSNNPFQNFSIDLKPPPSLFICFLLFLPIGKFHFISCLGWELKIVALHQG